MSPATTLLFGLDIGLTLAIGLGSLRGRLRVFQVFGSALVLKALLYVGLALWLGAALVRTGRPVLASAALLIGGAMLGGLVWTRGIEPRLDRRKG